MVLLLWLLQSEVELEQGCSEYHQREEHGERHSLHVAAEKVDELHVGSLRHDAVEQYGGRVVHPVEHHARHYAARAHVHPSEQQSAEERSDALRHIAVDDGEERCRERYGYPLAVFARHVAEHAQYGSAEHVFLGDRRYDADGDEAQFMAHDALEHLVICVGQFYAEQFVEVGERCNGANSEAHHPEHREPGSGVDIVARAGRPAQFVEQRYGDEAAHKRCDGCDAGSNACCLTD